MVIRIEVDVVFDEFRVTGDGVPYFYCGSILEAKKFIYEVWQIGDGKQFETTEHWTVVEEIVK